MLLLKCAAAGAETPISVRPEPTPDQKLHVTTTQDFTIGLNPGSAEIERPAAAIVSETVLAYTQANGRFNDQGLMESQLTIERFNVRQWLNGTAKQSPAIGQLVGVSLTALFDRGGKLVDVQVPKESQQASAVLKQLVAGAYGALNFLPKTAMSVGDTEAAPSVIPLRVPGGTEAVPYQTRTVTTLRAVEKIGDDRLARFEQHIQSAGDTDLVKVNGTGTIDVNLDRGFVAASATEWNFAGEDGRTGPANAARFGLVHGTIKVTVTAHE